MSAHQVPSHVAVSPACSGLWSLAAGRTVQMRPRQASTLKVVCGRVWATTDAPHDSAAGRLGDHVLGAGDAFVVLPGERLVVEAWGDTPVRFDWVVHAQIAPVTPSRWQAEVAAPVPQVPVVTLATAHPAKFRDAVERATGHRPSLPARIGDLFDREERLADLPGDYDAVADYIAARAVPRA